jgi:hypothetical protein
VAQVCSIQAGRSLSGFALLPFETRGDSFQSLLLLGHRGFQFSDRRFLFLNLATLFLHFAVLFEKLV